MGEVRVVGDLERTMNVWLDADRLDAYGLPITAVRDAIAAQNADVPGGNVTAADASWRCAPLGRFLDAAGFDELVVATRRRRTRSASPTSAAPRTARPSSARSRGSNGEPTVVLEVIRQSGANTVDVIDGVKANLELLRAELPADVELRS